MNPNHAHDSIKIVLLIVVIALAGYFVFVNTTDRNLGGSALTKYHVPCIVTDSDGNEYPGYQYVPPSNAPCVPISKIPSKVLTPKN